MSGYDNDNVFAKILRGELPCHKVYEDEKTFAFMDIMPRSDGHTLVIPKAPSRNLLDIVQAYVPSLLRYAVGVPAKVVRELDAADIQRARHPAEHYVEAAKVYRSAAGRPIVREHRPEGP